jgi:OmpA-OmpF porin, OOP family
MSTLTQEHQTFLAQVIALIPDSTKTRFADNLGLPAEQFRHGLATSLGKLITTLQDREEEPGLKASVIKLIPSLDAEQAARQLQQYNPDRQVDSGLEHLAQQFLKVVFGSRIASVADAIAVTSRMSQPAALGLLNVAAASLLAFLGQNRQRAAVLPWTGMTKANATYGGQTGAGIAAAGLATAAAPARKKRGILGWLIPAAIALLTVWGLMNLFNRPTPPINASSGVVAPVKVVSDKPVKSFTNQDLGRMIEVRLPSGMSLTIPENGIENQLLQFVQNPDRPVDKTTWFNFDRILFDSAKATLKKESYQQLDNVAAILQAFPMVQLKIGGYTDSSGNKASNQRLSAQRATAVMTHLTSLGVANNRLKAEGYGDQFPMASNASPEGRALNRRIALRVTQK